MIQVYHTADYKSFNTSRLKDLSGRSRIPDGRRLYDCTVLNRRRRLPASVLCAQQAASPVELRVLLQVSRGHGVAGSAAITKSRMRAANSTRRSSSGSIRLSPDRRHLRSHRLKPLRPQVPPTTAEFTGFRQWPAPPL